MGIIKRDGLKLTIISWVGIVLGYVNKIILFPKFLEPEQVGLANVLFSVAILFSQFSSAGTMAVVAKYFPYFKNPENKHHGILTWVFKYSLIGSVVVVLGMIVFKNPIAHFYSEKSPLLVEYYFYLIPLGLAILSYQIFDTYLRVQFNNVFASFAWEILLRLANTASVLLYAFDIIEFNGFVILYVLSNFTASVAILIYMSIKKLIHLPKVDLKVKRYKKHLFIFALFSVMSGAGNNFIATIDQIFIAGFVDLKAAGIFTTVAFITSVILVPYRAIIKISWPIITDLWKRKAIDEIDKLYKNVSTTMLLVSCFLFGVIWVCIDDLFSFMPKGEIYKAGKYVFLILSICRLFDVASGINGLIILTSRKYKYDLLFTFFLIIGTIGMNIYFVRILQWGINGAALTTALTLVIYNIMRIFFIYHHYKIQPFSVQFLLGLLFFTGALLITVFMPATPFPLLTMSIKTAVLTIVFWLTVYLTKISPDINLSINKLLVRWKILKKIP